jgi:uncharacterized membrane protein
LKENRILILISVFVTLIAVIGYFLINSNQFVGDLTVENYVVELSPDGTLIETYEYNVGSSGRYRMLYRYWEVPVVYDLDYGNPHVEVTNVDCQFTPYMKDVYGNVETFNGGYSNPYFIELKAYSNEIGCYNSNYFSKGKYDLKIDYKIYPIVNYDDEYFHLNFKLADEHIPYENVRIIIDDPEGDIVKLYTHPPMQITQNNNQYIVSGSSPSNTLLEFEIVSKNISYGHNRYVDNILEKTVNANNNYSLLYSIFSFLNYLLSALTLGFAIILMLIYYLRGKEKEYVVPEYLNFIPNKRKPWIVNLVFNKSEHKIDPGALYATLLDFHNRKLITINEIDSLLFIKINEKSGELDEYEERLYSFLKEYSVSGVINFNDFVSKIRSHEYNQSKIRRISRELNYLRKNAKSDQLKTFYQSGKRYPSILVGVSTIFFFVFLLSSMIYGNVFPMLNQTFLLSLILIAQSVIALLAPPALFGRWKEDYYKEKLEWDSFRNFLTDMAQLEKYKMQDILIWEEWLVYASALGVGKKVAKQMKILNINIPQTEYVPVMYGSFFVVNSAIMYSQGGSGGRSGGFSGGSFGGGFGGGGAGGR